MKTNIKFIRYVRNDPSQEKEIRFYSNGDKYWFLNSDYHREDGPSIEHINGYKGWYLKGVWYREEKDYWKALKEYKVKNQQSS